LPDQFGGFTKFTMAHAIQAGALVGCFVGVWALLLTLPVVTAVGLAVFGWAVHYVCWLNGGPLRTRVERDYDPDGRLRALDE
jgi:hypothetical protein